MNQTAVRMKPAAVAAAGAMVVGLLAGAARGDIVLTFESLAHVDNLAVSHGSTYEEGGYRLTTGVGEFSSYGTTSFSYAGSTALIAGGSPEVVTLAPIAGGLFDLVSIEIAKRDTAGSIFPVNVTFTGTKADNSTVMATFNGTVSGVLLQEFTFPASFTDLTQVTWSASQPHQFDNVTLVPAPGAAALVLLAGCAASRRRR